ncbi:hypothetical protein AVEN_19240-1 [Araneus ventricosus]|uniref:Uncharacterized protein n=1 Tax=Araneus ventricosus TaxID=182803 RepID=A0A4Y2WP73_ARAVE|nr:hypothetical protein AVEN_19240-1 [Araneus ventricosus]
MELIRVYITLAPIHEIAEDVGIIESSFHTIFTDNLLKHLIAAKYSPFLLNDVQTTNRVTVSHELLTVTRCADQKHVTGHNSLDLTLWTFFDAQS